MSRPSIERSPIRNPQCKVVEANDAFVELARNLIRVRQETNAQTARVVHVPPHKAWQFARDNELEAQDFFPPTRAPVHVGDGKVDVTPAVDRRELHDNMLTCRG